MMPAASSTCTGCGCPFKFGTFFRKESPVRHADYFTVWIGTHSKSHGYGFNPHFHGRMLERARDTNATAVYYAYIIAMLARHSKGIQDCDVGSPSLCEHGADFVRENEPLILDTYALYANHTAAVLGRAARVVWLMEPDFHQYTEHTQRGGGLPHSAMVRLFVAMVKRIKSHLPAAMISLDVSPWVQDVAKWMAPFLQHGSVDFLHTSGGRTTAGSARIRAQEPGNLLTWSALHKMSGRGLIADTGYGIGGKLSTDPALDNDWLDAHHLRARIADGVIAVTHANPGNSWAGAKGKVHLSPRAIEHINHAIHHDDRSCDRVPCPCAHPTYAYPLTKLPHCPQINPLTQPLPVLRLQFLSSAAKVATLKASLPRARRCLPSPTSRRGRHALSFPRNHSSASLLVRAGSRGSRTRNTVLVHTSSDGFKDGRRTAKGEGAFTLTGAVPFALASSEAAFP